MPELGKPQYDAESVVDCSSPSRETTPIDRTTVIGIRMVPVFFPEMLFANIRSLFPPIFGF
jgi:hypothetical protein